MKLRFIPAQVFQLKQIKVHFTYSRKLRKRNKFARRNETYLVSDSIKPARNMDNITCEFAVHLLPRRLASLPFLTLLVCSLPRISNDSIPQAYLPRPHKYCRLRDACIHVSDYQADSANVKEAFGN